MDVVQYIKNADGSMTVVAGEGSEQQSLVDNFVSLLSDQAVVGAGTKHSTGTMKKYLFECYSSNAASYTAQIQAVGPSGVARDLKVFDELAQAYVAGNTNITADGFYSVLVPPFANIQANVSAIDGTHEVDTLTVTAGATASANVTVTLNGVAVNIAVAASDTAATVATKIAAGTYTGFSAAAVGAVVTFTATAGGVKAAPAYSAGTTGATGTFAVTTAGAAPELSIAGGLMQ